MHLIGLTVDCGAAGAVADIDQMVVSVVGMVVDPVGILVGGAVDPEQICRKIDFDVHGVPFLSRFGIPVGPCRDSSEV